MSGNEANELKDLPFLLWWSLYLIRWLAVTPQYGSHHSMPIESGSAGVMLIAEAHAPMRAAPHVASHQGSCGGGGGGGGAEAGMRFRWPLNISS